MRRLWIAFVSTWLAVPAAGFARSLTPLEELGKALFYETRLSTPPGQSCAACHDPAVGWSGPDSDRNAAGGVYPGAIPTRFGNRKPPSAAYAGFHPILHRCGMDCPCMGGGGCGGMGGGGMGGGATCGGGTCGGGMGGGGMGGGTDGAMCAGGMGGGMGGGTDGAMCAGGMGGGMGTAMCEGGIGGGGMGRGGMGGGGMGGMSPGDFVGGTFWDGRATGWLLGDPLAEQAMGPFLNPLEQNNPNAKHVCLGVRDAGHGPLFEEVWGAGSLDCVKDADGTYVRIARAIAAYERSPEVSAFTSRFDRFWDAARAAGLPVPMIDEANWGAFAGKGLSDLELEGLAIFNTRGSCSACHALRPMHGSRYPLFTDFRYHNVGVPRSPENPFYGMPRPWNPQGERWVDLGLGGFLATAGGAVDSAGVPRDYRALWAENAGRHKTPTLRNVELRPDPGFVKAYGHNGYFKSLAAIVHFYNVRDALPVCGAGGTPGEGCFPPPELPQNLDPRVGNLGLTETEENALVAFLKTLDDGYAPAPPAR